MQIDDPAPDLATHAASLGVEAAGPIRTIEQLRPALAFALTRLRQGVPYILDVHVGGGYVSGIAGKN